MTSLTFAISEDTEFYGEIAVGMKIEIEHTEDQALYIQPAEHRAGSGPSRARSLLHPDYLISG